MQNDIIFGIRAVIEAIRSGKQVDKIWLKRGLRSELYHELMDLVKQHELPVQQVPATSFRKFPNKNHQGVLAFLAPVEFQDMEEIIPSLFEEGKVPFLLVLDKISDVGNFGAIIRSAECAGVDAVIIPAKGSARVSSDTVKTSAGAIHHVPVCKVKSLQSAIEYIRMSGITLCAVTEKAEMLYHQQDYKQPLALLMGAEDRGIAKEFLEMADLTVKIPLKGKIDSLNVSAATAVVLFEAVKQRAFD
jgi:23S rRNA (guanosine2251-2'-O)-methyltransferase